MRVTAQVSVLAISDTLALPRASLSAELACLIVPNCFHDFLTCVHHERSVRDDGLTDRLRVTEEQKGRTRRHNLDGFAVAFELDQMLRPRSLTIDRQIATHHV